MKGIKGFDKNLQCRGMQFEVGKEYKIEGKGKVNCCDNSGIHFCKDIKQVHNYYNVLGNNRFCEIEALGDVAEEQDKCSTNHIKIIREITGEELDKLIGKTNGNTGIFNSGNCNSGDYNSGDCNSGYCNSGNRNSGDYNSGDFNSGDYNSGDFNSGDFNSGDFNACNHSTGFFNTKERTITIFNIDSGLTFEEATETDWFNVVQQSIFKLTEWINYTDEEKKDSIIRQCIGGYLKKYTYKEACQNWWNGLSDRGKEIIQTIPNFNKDVFKEITGIEVK